MMVNTMKIMTVLILFAGAMAWAIDKENDYSEDRVLAVDGDGVEVLDIDAGSGSLKIQGTADSDGVVVLAVVRVDTDDEKKAKDFMDAGKLVPDEVIIGVVRGE